MTDYGPFLFRIFTFVPLTRTHYSDLPLILKHAQIFPSALVALIEMSFRAVSVQPKGSDRLLDIFAPLSMSHLQVGPTNEK